MSFTKLDSGIVDSSLWAYPAEERIVWITLLAKADETGFVRISFSGLVRAANVSEEATRRAVDKFSSPDAESRTESYDGRRIEHIEGGWVILNYMKYREKTDKDSHREYMRKYRDSLVNHSKSQVVTVESPSASASTSVSASDSAFEDRGVGKETTTGLAGYDEQYCPYLRAIMEKYPSRKQGLPMDIYRSWAIAKKIHNKTAKELSDMILIALEWQTQKEDWLDGFGKYAPSLEKYINGGGWLEKKPDWMA